MGGRFSLTDLIVIQMVILFTLIVGLVVASAGTLTGASKWLATQSQSFQQVKVEVKSFLKKELPASEESLFMAPLGFLESEPAVVTTVGSAPSLYSWELVDID